MKKQIQRIIYLACVFLNIGLLQLSAANLTWIGNNGNWTNQNGWFRTSFPAGICGCVPTSSDNVTINAGIVTIPEVGFSTTASARTLFIGADGELRVGGNSPTQISRLNIGPADEPGITIEDGGQLTVFARDQVNVDGIFRLANPEYCIYNSGDIDVEVNGRINVTGPDGGIFSEKAIVNQGIIDVSGINNRRALHIIGVIDNRSTGTILIDDIRNGDLGQGILVSGDFSFFNNLGTISISDVEENAIQVMDNSIFNNAGPLTINDFREAGIRVDDDGAFFNSRLLTITNASTADSYGVRVENGGEFTNSGEMDISNIISAAFGIWNKGQFTNIADADIQVTNFRNNGIQNGLTGVFENLGAITVKTNQGNITSHGFYNLGDLSFDEDGKIQIVDISGFNSHGFLNDANGVFTNEGAVTVDGVANGKGIFFESGDFNITKTGSVTTKNISSDALDIALAAELDCEEGGAMDIGN